MKTKVYSVTEFGTIYPESAHLTSGMSLQQVIMPDADFDALCRYIETQLTEDEVEDRIFKILYKRHQKVVKAQNQVGVVQFANGLQIEILPKIAVRPDENERAVLRQLLLKLLSHIRDYPYLLAGEAQLSSQKDYPILEVFIRSYIQELESICTNGLKSEYERVDENLNVLKGKLLIKDNIRANRLKLTKFYCRYQRYTPNSPVNRIIKATLEKLLSSSRTFQNRDKLYRLLDVFTQVETSKNIQTDLQKALNLDRTYKEYQKIIMWSRLFLNNSSVTSTQGNVVNTSIVFPMEKVFEDYIAFLFKKFSKDYIIRAQDRSVFLVTHRNRGKFRLRPDIVVANDEAPVLIVDTKWKLLNAFQERENYGISQSDMYQLYAYGKKYELEHNKGKEQRVKPPHLVLLYPENENFKKKLDHFTYEGDLQLDIIPFSFANGMEEVQVRRILDIISDRQQAEKHDQNRIIPAVFNHVVVISNTDYQERTDKRGIIPLYSLRAACGRFESEELPSAEGWIDASGHGFFPDPKRHFAVHAKGNSMLPKIKDGDVCVFEWYEGGSRNGDIVLTQTNAFDAEYGAEFTIKQYHSEKKLTEDGWQHTKVELIPLNKDYEVIALDEEEAYRTIGIFKCVLK